MVSTQTNKPVVDAQTNSAPNQPVRQKLGITRGADGKITSVTGLQPGQQLIESPQGLRIVTSAPNRPDRKVIQKSDIPNKLVTKVVSAAQDGDASTTKPPILMRQPARPGNLVVKSVTNKTLTPGTGQRVILNNAQMATSSPAQQIVTSKRQIAANSVQQKIIRATNMQQVVGGQNAQKYVINSSNTGNKIILAQPANSQSQNSTVTTQQTLLQNSTNQQQVRVRTIL